MGEWVGANEFLRDLVEVETDWAARHSPNIGDAPPRWKPIEFVPYEEIEAVPGEDNRAKVTRLYLSGYGIQAISAGLGLNMGYVSRLLNEERNRIGAVQA